MKDAREMLPVLQEHSPETEQATASEPPPERKRPVGGDGFSRYRDHERPSKGQAGWNRGVKHLYLTPETDQGWGSFYPIP